MPPLSAQPGFPRRVVALYLLFCLGAVLLLTAGAVVAVRSLLNSQATGGALTRVGRLAAALELSRLGEAPARMQSLVDQAAQDGRLAYCGVIGPDGRFVAHTDQSLVGGPAIDPVGSQLRWGDIDGVRFRDATDRDINEYRAPLRVDGANAGALVLAVAEPGWRGVLANLGEYAPWAVAAPLALIALGGWLLARATGRVAGIEARLAEVAKLPHLAAPTLDPIPPASVAAVGWNRLVQHVAELRDSRPDGSLAGGQPPTGIGSLAANALESLAEGIAVTDPEGRIEFANRAIAALLGAEGDLAGAEFDALLEHLAPQQAGVLRGAAATADAVAEVPIGTDDGGRTLRVSRSPLRGDAAQGHVWTARDITQQKLAEESRDRFIDTATHELRTPLANIKAYAETLAMCDMSDVEQQKEFCNTINTEATRLARFVDDLLSLSSIEVGTLGVLRQNVDVRRLADEAAEKVAPLMKQRSLRFEVSLAEKLGEARLDKDKVSGLLVNLLGNAAKYTPSGGAVTFTAVRKDDALQFEVRDTGVGIAPDEQDRVFEKFFRSANPAVQDQVGTGLGLSLAREIARLHRGDLTLKSEFGAGSTFTVLLPTQ